MVNLIQIIERADLQMAFDVIHDVKAFFEQKVAEDRNLARRRLFSEAIFTATYAVDNHLQEQVMLRKSYDPDKITSIFAEYEKSIKDKLGIKIEAPESEATLKDLRDLKGRINRMLLTGAEQFQLEGFYGSVAGIDPQIHYELFCLDAYHREKEWKKILEEGSPIAYSAGILLGRGTEDEIRNALPVKIKDFNFVVIEPKDVENIPKTYLMNPFDPEDSFMGP